ncbi:polyprenyl synthetase family protein [Clostridium aestuarii]|uniref:Polyprenyl synthetase family protein n=1 Tax=Clostridium aestuarii TaxID=338193 RepID=A0ABT4D0H9_9CLOT|nr:polyprenyl synthetase family protein [Clostridium aestuarii]MCY6484741.1 polyprenyl synthetase family protein [Clostridium aestuarii]
MSKVWDKYPQVSKELESVKNIIKENIKTSEKYFQDSVIPLVDNGGKMLRAAFLLLSAKFGKYDKKKMHNLAAIIEILHLATLIHDDIIDNSKLRRGCESIQSKYGKEYAVYAGDILFCQCFSMLSQDDYTMDNMRSISKAVKKICMGEIKQNYFRYTRKVDLKKYIRIVSGKTAALFVLSFSIGAKEAECDENTVKLLGRIGYNIGMAFQVVDDLLDYDGETKKLGKSAQSDLKQGYYTLPIILALQEDKSGELSNILDNSNFNEDEVKSIVDLVKKYNGLEKARKIAERYTQRAFNGIEQLQDCESKDILKQIVKKLINRCY